MFYKTLALLNSMTTGDGIVILLLLAAFYALAMLKWGIAFGF
jgi:hypothetical protein